MLDIQRRVAGVEPAPATEFAAPRAAVDLDDARVLERSPAVLFPVRDGDASDRRRVVIVSVEPPTFALVGRH